MVHPPLPDVSFWIFSGTVVAQGTLKSQSKSCGQVKLKFKLLKLLPTNCRVL